MGLPGIAQRPCTLSGTKYMPGDAVPAEVMSRKIAMLGLAAFVPEAAAAGVQAGTEAAKQAFDPGEHKAADVLAYLDDHPDQLERIYVAESDGQKRKGLLSDLEARVALSAQSDAGDPSPTE